nr:MAG TPA: hypothetical protein [Caudoviricetes sp.]
MINSINLLNKWGVLPCIGYQVYFLDFLYAIILSNMFLKVNVYLETFLIFYQVLETQNNTIIFLCI